MINKPLLPPAVTTTNMTNITKTTGQSRDNSHGFQTLLASALEEVNRLQQDAHDKTRLMIIGGDIETHEVMLAVQKAELALELTQSVRNKVVESYQEIMRMQV
ncbi:MAG: flagellar hook-basal body complex protein FliE [bacterium]|jgi:flagellar hook-basal body complex protein FliE